MTESFLADLSTLILIVSVGYLAWRFARQWATQARSYRELPFGTPEITSTAFPVDCARGAMLGIAIGDALGMPRENVPVSLARLRFGSEPGFSRGVIRLMRRRGTVSDDTQLTVATARSIDDEKVYRDDEFETKLVDWIDHAIGPGKATMQAAIGLRRGKDTRLPASQGNGAAMRIVPLAIAYAADTEQLVETTRRNAAVTHPNPEAVAGAEAMARLVAACLRNRTSELPSDLVEVTLPSRSSEELDDWRARLEHASSLSGENGLAVIGTTGWVKHTVPAVVYLLKSHGDRLEEAFREIFRAGGDVDTLAGLYAACVGAWRGTGIFRDDWIREVQGASILVEEADRLSAAPEASDSPGVTVC